MDFIKKDTSLSSQTMTFSYYSAQKMRLDEFLALMLQSSKSQVLQLIKNGNVTLNDKCAQKGGINLKQNDRIRIYRFEKPESSGHLRVDFDIEILYEDEDILVLNKPPFVVVHKAPSVKEATLVDWLESKHFTLSTLAGKERTGIIHRLDKETSGAICIAKNNATHTALSKQLQSKQMGRYYLAVIDSPLMESKMIECDLGRHPKNRLKMVNANSLRIQIPNARYSKSHFVPILESKSADLQLIAVKLYTGRTHQIRAHLESISRHIIGDTLYGYKGKENVRIMLHACLLHLVHPHTQKEMIFYAPVFTDMLQFCFFYFDQKEVNEAIQTDRILQYFM